MPVPLSTDLRWRIVWLHLYKDMNYKQVADLLYVHVSTVRRIINLYESTGSVAPAEQKRGPQRMLSDIDQASLVETLLSRPESYLDELQQELFRNTGTWTSVSTLFRTIRRLGLTRKKLQRVALQRSDSERIQFMEEMSLLSADMIVWLDETGSDRRKETRKFGYHL